MEQYLKPSILIVSCGSLGVKLQATGEEPNGEGPNQASLICTGQACDQQLGSPCGMGVPEVHLLEENVTCPSEPDLPSCVVTVLSVNGTPAENPDSNCWPWYAQQCGADCRVDIVCSPPVSCSLGDSIQATVSCPGFDEPASCTSGT